MAGFANLWLVDGGARAPAPWVDGKAMLCVLALLAFGFVMVTSSSLEIAARNLHDPLHFLERQVVYALIGVLCAAVAYFIAPETVFRNGGWLMAAASLLLLIVFLPEIGKTVHGSRRWISVGGLTFQPSEFAKLALVIYLAGYIARRHAELRKTMSAFVKPMLIVVFIGFLLLLQPDYGTAALMAAVAFSMLWIAGVKLRCFFSFVLVFGSALALLAVSSPYRWRRIVAFADPWQDPFDSGYQLTQSLIAVGSGGWSGAGLGNSVLKLFYLPEAHTDFIFSVVAEELGFIGVCLMIALFWLLVQRCFAIGARARSEDLMEGAYLSYGIGVWFGLQAFVNMAVAMGMLPTKGITLPFISVGGSSLVVSLVCIGLLMRIHYEAQCRTPSLKYRRATRGGRVR